MGDWAKHEYGQDKLPKRCYLFAGTTPEHVKEQILDQYTEVIFRKHDVYERYIVGDGQSEDVLIFQAYGAAVVADLLSVLKDGGVEEIIFVGTAFGITTEMNTGDVVLPTAIQCLDGITTMIDAVEFVTPDEEFRKQLSETFKQGGVAYKEGQTVSVPTAFWRVEGSKFGSGLIALEMELSAFIHFTGKLGVRSGGVLIISDTVNHSLLDDQAVRFKRIVEVFTAINSLKR